ncbi:MAG TPA: Holliday junction resolvase RuvX [Gemmataceae bacterium]|nr:Holliday junction resolvase RuvX [Gemmataceae bacterium]
MRPRTRLLGVDYGSVRVGLAITDELRMIASPLATYQRRDEALDAEFFRQIVEREEVGGLVVGLPVHMSGDEGEKAAEARKFGAWLAAVTGLPVVYWDERFTTKEAEAHLRSAGLSPQRRKARRDRVAAQIILQTYLEAGCPTNDT